MPLRGYKPLGGKSRRYSKPGGGSISRRAYDDIRARKAGFKDRAALESYRESLQSTRWNRWVINVKKNTGRNPTFEDYGNLELVRRKRARLKRLYPLMNAKERDSMDPSLVAPDGPLANVLDAAGLRPKNGRPVGDS